MQVYTKFEILCEKKKPTIMELITFNRTKLFHIWAPWVINNFRDQINTKIFDIISIKPTDDKMEMYWNSNSPFFDEDLRKNEIVLSPSN